MSNYQLLGDGFGYHPSYGLTGNPSNSNPGGPEPQPPGSNNSVMTSMGIGSPAYGMIPPHGPNTHGLPQRSLPPFGMPPGSSGSGLVHLGGPSGLGDASKMHDQYASSGFPGGAAQSAMRSGHYPTHDSRYGHSNSGYPVPGMGGGPGGPSSLGGMSQHNGGIVPQSSLTQLSSSNSYQNRGLMSGYNDQRMLSPILGPGPGSGYPGSYPSSYGPGPTSGPSARIWHNQGMSHVQQRPPYGYNPASSVAPPPPHPHTSTSGRSNRQQQQQQQQPPPPPPFGHSASDYGSLHSQQPTKQSHQPLPTQQSSQQQQQSQSQAQPTRPYYSSSNDRVAPSSSLTSFIPSEASSMSPYLTSSYNSQNVPGNSGSSRLPDPNSIGANSNSRQPHYTSLGYPSAGPGSSSAAGMLSSNTPGSMNYPGQQYQGYSVSQGYGDSSSRLSPYTMGPGSTSGQNTGPNSPGYRPPFSASSLASMSPRRPTPTPPAGSPMPPTSRTPDRGTTTLSTSGPTNSYPSSGQLTSPNSGLSPGNSSTNNNNNNNATKSSGLPAPPPGSSSSSSSVTASSSAPASQSSSHNASSSSASAPASQSSSSSSSSASASASQSSHGPVTSHQSTPISSLQQLEQMVMPHLNSSSSTAAPTNKINSISSIISSASSSSNNSSSSNQYYPTMSGSNIHAPQQQQQQQQAQKSDQQSTSNMYPRFPSPSPTSSGSGNYYGNSGYPPNNSSSWRPPTAGSQPTTGQGSNSMSNTQSPMNSSIPYSPASQIDTQSQSKEVPSPGISRTLTSTGQSVGPNTMTSTTSNNNSNSMTGQQYSMFDNQSYSASSPSIDNSNYQTQSSSKQDIVNKNVMSPRNSSSNQQSQQPMSPFNFRNIEANKTSSFGSPQIVKDDSGSESKGDNDKQQGNDTSNSNIYSVLSSSSNAGGDNRNSRTNTPSNETLTTRSSQENMNPPGPPSRSGLDSGYHSNYMSGPNEPSYGMGQQQAPQQQQQQSSSSDNSMYSNQQPGSQPQSSWDYGSGYNQSYDMNMSNDGGMNPSYMGPDSMMYSQNYNQGPGMPPGMMGNQMNQNEYGSGSVNNDMSQNYDPYGDTFDQEPPIAKKKGKGRPRKDPSEPKKEKKPRAPRAPKGAGTRGRGRGARSSPESRMGASPIQPSPIMPGSMTPGYDNSYSMGGNPNEMYPNVMSSGSPYPGPGSQMSMDSNMSGGMSYPPPPPQHAPLPHQMNPHSQDMYGQLPPPDFQHRPDLSNEMMYPPPPDPSRIPVNEQATYKPLPPDGPMSYDSQHVQDASPQLNQPQHPQQTLTDEDPDIMQHQAQPQEQSQMQQLQPQSQQSQEPKQHLDKNIEETSAGQTQQLELSNDNTVENDFSKSLRDETMTQSSSSETINSTGSNEGQPGDMNDTSNAFHDPNLTDTTSGNFFGVTGDESSMTQNVNINQDEQQQQKQQQQQQSHEDEPKQHSDEPHQQQESKQQELCNESFVHKDYLSSMDQNFPNQSSTPPPPVEAPQLLPPPPDLPPQLPENSCDDSVVISKMEFNEEQTPSSTPVKRKAKKRKAKDMKDGVPFDEGPFMSEGGHQTFFSEDGQGSKKKKRKRKKKEENEDAGEEFGEVGAIIEGPADDPEKSKKKKKKKPKKKVNEEEKEDEVKPSDDTLVEGEISVPLIGEIENAPEDTTFDGSLGNIEDTSLTKSKSSGKKKRPSRAKPKLKDDSGKSKKKLPKLALKFGKSKKRKRLGSSDASDIEKTPPPSPEDPDSAALKRRSARNTKRQKYTDDIDLDLSADDADPLEAAKLDGSIGPSDKKIIDSNVQVTKISEDTMVVEKIMSSRMGERELEAEEGEDLNGVQTIQVEEYYVKYKNLSYLHCEWRTEEELEMGDKRVNQKIKRWKQKKESEIDINFLDDELFNPDYTEVDRILDVQEIEETIEEEVEVDDDDEDSRSDTKVDILPVILNPESKTEEGDESEKMKCESIDTGVTIAAVPIMPESSDLQSKIEADNKIDDEVGLKIETDPTNEPCVDEKQGDTEIQSQEIEMKVAESDEQQTKSESFESENVSEATEDKSDQEIAKTIDTNIDVNISAEVIGEPSVDNSGEKKDEIPCEEQEKPEDDQIITEKEVKIDESQLNDVKDESKENIENKVPVESESNVLPVKRKKKVLRKKTTRHYLVKWRALPYEESTWELEDDLDPLKIAHFWKFKSPPPKDKWKPKKRPKANEWKKLDSSPAYKAGNTLREYQLEGVNWLMFCWHNGRNCILADEMGLGKTIQSISFIQEMFKYGVTGPFLVIAPLSTIGNWQREFETWTDLNVITYHGSSASRNMLQEYEMYYKKENGERHEGFYKFQVMITTFEIVLTDCLELREIHWRACIIDEAHRLKNRNCKLLEGLRLLNMEHRVLLTGTPLQNNVEELFSLLNFLEPNQFSSSEVFMAEFGDLKTEDQVDKLKALLKPMMLRRLKEDVEKSLAPKEETIIEVELTNVQKKYYRAILERNFQFLTKGNSKTNVPNLMNTMMELRKCCIHPYLINGAEEQIIHEYKQNKGDSPTFLLDALVHASGKLVLIDKLLPRLKADGHRVLIFSQMVRCLDILEDYLCQKKYPFERIDGRVRGNMRQAAIDRFSKPGSDRFVFLLCTRAGGLGINLTAADTVIIFDSDWNPQNDLQAQARCHRIGQSKMVKVYRLICRNTYEREMFDKASLKLGLDRAVLQSMNSNAAGLGENGLSKSDVEDLLRKGAYGAIMDDDNAGDKFCEEDIEQILQRRTQIITLESEEKGSTFSKASFAASDNRSDIEIDDPNFWEKWAKKAQLDVDELTGKNDLIVQEPRRRTQTKRFGQDEQMLEISDADSSDEDEENVSTRTRGGKTKFKLKKGKRGREREDEFMEDFAPGNWTKAECYQVEKGLLCYGWGRWDKYLETGIFKRHITIQDIEHVAQVIMLQCLQNGRGDDKKKELTFYWDIISPSDYKVEDAKVSKISVEEENIVPSPSSGSSRRRSKKSKLIAQPVVQPMLPNEAPEFSLISYDWAKEDLYNPDLLLPEDYRNHVIKISNKILLRFKLLWYLKTEIFGELSDKICKDISYRDAPFSPPIRDGYPGLPPWWDEDADKSLLMGVYKHGYDRYNRMRLDPALCFLTRCGPPDGTALIAELQSDDINKEDDDENEASEVVNNEFAPKDDSKGKEGLPSGNEEYMPFPLPGDLNKRFRNLISAYQRNVKKQERLERNEAVMREKRREAAQRRWSKKDDSDFYRTIISFGVEYNKDTNQYEWSRFRLLSKLDKKSDESLTEYFKSFFAMCKKVTGRSLSEEEENYNYLVDPISEDKATRALARIELLCKIREDILPHPELDDRLTLCQTSIDLPDWWICGRHDKDLLVGAAKYGLNRLDINLMNDPELSFMKIFRNDDAESKSKAEVKQSQESVKRETTLEINKIEAKPKTKDQSPKGSESVKKLIKENIEDKMDKEVKKSDDGEEIKTEVADDEKIPSESNDAKVSDDQSSDLKSNEAEAEEASVEEKEKSETKDESSSKPEDLEKMDVDETNEKESQSKSDDQEEKEELAEEKVSDEENSKMEKEKDQENVSNEEDEKRSTKEEDDLQKQADMSVDGDQVRPCESSENNISGEKKEDAEESQVPSDVDKSIDETKEKDELEAQEEKEKENTEEEPKTEEEKDGKVSNVEDSEEKPEDSKVDGAEDSEKMPEEESKINNENELEKADDLSKSAEKEDDSKEKIDESSMKEKELDESTESQESKVKSESEAEKKSHPTHMEITIVKNETTPVESKVASGNILENDPNFFSQSADNFASRGFIRWPKERVLIVRLEQICHCVEKNEWPFCKQNLFTALATVPSTPSIATADSSPRAASPVSISSMSREPTPQATPDNTPRHESVSPSPDPFMFDVANASGMIDSGGRLRSRGRRRRRYEMDPPDRVKLRNLLSQPDTPMQSSKKNLSQHSSQMLANTPPFLPPLFSMSLPNFRNEMANDDKGSSILMAHSHSHGSSSKSRSHAPPPPTVGHPFASLSSIKTPLTSPISDHANKSSKSQGAPPPAHSSSNTKRTPNLDTLDLKFAKPVPGQQPMTPASKPLPPPDKVVKRSSTPVSLSSVLDLSGPIRKDSSSDRSKEDDSSASGPLTSPTLTSRGKSGKRIGRRIDDLATNLLQRKKMQQEKQDDPVPEKPKLSSPMGAARELKARSELDKVETRGSSSSKDRTRTPPAAHSSSRSSSMSASLARDMQMKPPEKANFATPKVFPPRSGHKESTSSSRQQSVSADIAGNLSSNLPKLDASFLDQTTQLKKYLEEHPELLTNPNFVSAFANLTGSSPLSANTQLLELPDNRKRSSRRSKVDVPQHTPPKTQSLPPPAPMSSHQSLANPLGFSADEHIPLVNRLNGKKLSGSKAPTLKQLPDFLKKNPMYELDPKYANLLRDSRSSSKASSSHSRDVPAPSTIRTRTSDRKSGESSNNKSKNSTNELSPRRATAASLLANQAAANATAISSATTSTTPATSSSFGFPPSTLNPFGGNSNLLSNSFHKMLMDPNFISAAAGMSSASSGSRSNNNNVSSSSAATTSTSSAANAASSMLFPFGMGLANPLFNLPGLGLNSGFNPFSVPGLGTEGSKKKDHGSSSSSADKNKSSSDKSGSSSHKSGKNSSSKNATQNPNQNPNQNPSPNLNDPASFYNSLPFLYSNSLLYSHLGLGGFSMPPSPFASLAQSGLMNGLGNLAGLGTTSSTSTTTTTSSASPSLAKGSKSSSSHAKTKNSPSSSSSQPNTNPTPSSSKHPRGSSSSASSMKSPTHSIPQQAKSTSNISGPTMTPSMTGAAGLADSDDESLRSLMGQEDDEDDLNGDLEDSNENLDTDTDSLVDTASKKSKLRSNVKSNMKSGVR
ncbi:chromodomain-helicase-DNA-binding protein 7 isoform X2 [Tetranychus urticae]|uniref:Chromo domain-containing protein n=1 Tax=Tetranychus urticae TaxID=32264 RepID=T1L420_TETUR|nr:chromodomain-helicase-DNA-binding protein 7 isoform X2 [Tetranychus urticae]